MRLDGLAIDWHETTCARTALDRFSEGLCTLGDLELQVRTVPLGTGLRIDVTVRNPARFAVHLDRIRIGLDERPKLVVEQGYQSWSPIHRRSWDARSPWRSIAPGLVRATYHADPSTAGKAVCSDQYMVSDCCVVGFLDARQHLSTVVLRRDGRGLWAVAILDGVRLGPGEQRDLDPLWCSIGDPGELYSELADHWASVAGARSSARRTDGKHLSMGWSSWYQYFWRVNPKDVLSNLDLAARQHLDVLQIDDGYQAAIGDWLATNPRWNVGTASVAAQVHARGMEAGIWTAPFLAGSNSRLLRDHPDWLAGSPRRPSTPLRAMYNPVAWGGWAYALDTTRPQVLDYLRDTFSGLASQGFDYYKIDFCYAATLPGARNESERYTRAQGLRAGLDAIREAIGEDRFLLGCGCPLGPAVGVVDAMRVSPDVAPRWSPGVIRYPAYADAAPSAANAVRASVLRAPLHRRVFINDPDCILLRPSHTHLDESKRHILSATVAGTGGFMTLSDDLSLYGDAEWALVEILRALQEYGDATLEIADPFARCPTVRSSSLELTLSWERARTRLGSLPFGLGRRQKACVDSRGNGRAGPNPQADAGSKSKHRLGEPSSPRLQDLHVPTGDPLNAGDLLFSAGEPYSKGPWAILTSR